MHNKKLLELSRDLLQAISDNVEPPSGMINSQYIACEVEELANLIKLIESDK